MGKNANFKVRLHGVYFCSNIYSLCDFKVYLFVSQFLPLEKSNSGTYFLKVVGRIKLVNVFFKIRRLLVTWKIHKNAKYYSYHYILIGRTYDSTNPYNKIRWAYYFDILYVMATYIYLMETYAFIFKALFLREK